MNKSGCGFFCVVIGPDGSGKTSLLYRLKQLEPKWICVSASPTDLYPLSGLEYMNWALYTHPRDYVKRMHPLTRTLFFMKTLAIEYEYHIEPALANGSVVICDSYYYRFLAKERVHNPTGAALFEYLPGFFPEPNLILWLKIPLNIAYRRKPTLTVFEVNDDYSEEGFQCFQGHVLKDIQKMVNRIPTVSLDATKPSDGLAKAAAEAIHSATLDVHKLRFV